MSSGGNIQLRWFGIAWHPFPRIPGGPWRSWTVTLRIGPRKRLL